MQNLSIEAASDESARGLCMALARFRPRWTIEEDGRHFVSVELGSDGHVLEVFDAIQKHVADRVQGEPVSSLAVALDGHSYSVHDR